MATADSSTDSVVNSYCCQRSACNRCFTITLLMLGYDVNLPASRLRHRGKEPNVLRSQDLLDIAARLTKAARLRQRTYGIDEQTYQAMLMDQGGTCALCQKVETRMANGIISPLSVDHDHTTGAVRKLLCGRCNRILGFIEPQEADWFSRTKAYLEEHGAWKKPPPAALPTTILLARDEIHEAAMSGVDSLQSIMAHTLPSMVPSERDQGLVMILKREIAHDELTLAMLEVQDAVSALMHLSKADHNPSIVTFVPSD